MTRITRKPIVASVSEPSSYTSNGKYVPKPPPSPKTHPKKAVAIQQLYVIQQCLFDDIKDSETTPAARAQLARAWSELEDRKRILRGKGLPKPVEPLSKPKQPRPRESFSESPEANLKPNEA